MALILSLQGLSRFLIWKVVYDSIEISLTPFTGPKTHESAIVFADALRENLTHFQDHFRGSKFVDFYNYNHNLTSISQLNISTQHGQRRAIILTEEIIDAAVDYLFNEFDITETESVGSITSVDKVYVVGIKVFATAFYYFIIGSGFVLLLLGVMYWFGKRHKSRYEWASLVLRLAAGFALTMVVLTIYEAQVERVDGTVVGTNMAADIVRKQWAIPIVLLVFATGQFTSFTLRVLESMQNSPRLCVD